MSEQPAAFMSYVRFNDQHDDGQLTKFCERLSAEVQVQTGEEFPIFQDRKDITWGQNWKIRIEETLDTVTLLIPIITPSFFRSHACRAEVERFLIHERKLGRQDLILPVYYVSTPKFDDPKRRDADELARVLASRQYADWRELRFEPFASPVVRKALAQLANRMRDIFWHQPPAQASRPGKSRLMATQAAGSEAMETEPADTALTAAAKTELPTHVVDAYQRGDFATIGPAIKAAGPGDRILVRPGLYEEGLVIDKPLELLGDGPVEDIVVQARGADALLFKANIGRVANLTLRQAGGEGKYYGVNITQGRLEVEGCDITSQSLAGVAIRNGADPRLRRNRIHDSEQSGVFVSNNGLGTLEDNDITTNGYSGVAIKAGGNPTLRRNQIHHNKRRGVFVYDNGVGMLEDNDITTNGVVGVAIKTGGNPTLRRNQIHHNREAGVFVYDNGVGMLEDNDISTNSGAGLQIMSGGNPTVRDNQIHDNMQAGVAVSMDGLGMLEENDITANGEAGLEIMSGGNPTVRRNRIKSNAYEAVWVLAGGCGVVEDNDLRGNTGGPWDIADDSKPNVKRSRNRT
jgi:parallel beta-helix repeat protein